MICACVIVVYFSLSFSIMVSCWVLGFCWVSNGGGGGYRAAHHRRAIRFHTDKNKKALSKIPQENKKTVSVKLDFRVVFYLNIFGHFGQLVFSIDYDNYLSLFMACFSNYIRF